MLLIILLIFTTFGLRAWICLIRSWVAFELWTWLLLLLWKLVQNWQSHKPLINLFVTAWHTTQVYQLKCTNPGSLNRLYRCCPSWETACFDTFRPSKDQMEATVPYFCHSLSAVPACTQVPQRQRPPKLHTKGLRAWPNEGEKAKPELLIQGEAVAENCWGKTGLWPSRQEVKIRIALAKRIWHKEEWITGLGALRGN